MAKKLTEEEIKDNQDFRELCLYIEQEILHYEVGQKLQKKSILRLRGLSNGQVIANNKQDKFGEYPFIVILLTFKLHRNVIIKSLLNKDIDSEDRKMAYICAIIRDKINDVYTRYLNSKKSEDKIETLNTDIATYEGAEYKKHNQDDNKARHYNTKLEELW